MKSALTYTLGAFIYALGVVDAQNESMGLEEDVVFSVELNEPFII